MVSCIVGISSPNDHFTPSPDSSGELSSDWGAHRGRSRPAVGAGIVFPASICVGGWIDIKWNDTAPDDHLATSPDCYMVPSRSWRFPSLCPAIAGGVVSPTDV